jgi:Protein of unknown function (DUF3551)
MRILALTILTAATVVTAAPASAQTYDPAYPVCIRTSGFGGSSIDCSFTSLPQCNATASGRAAQCFDNPFFGYGKTSTGPLARRPRGG